MPLKIAYIGLKGIPARWGGIERYVEEIAKGMSKKGHHVTVYTRKWFTNPHVPIDAIHTVNTPTIKAKATDALIHGFTSTIHACLANYDIIHYHGFASYYSSLIPRLASEKIVITMHGKAWEHPKWGFFGRSSIKFANFIGLRLADSVTTIAPFLMSYLRRFTNKHIYLTPPGIHIKGGPSSRNMLDKYGLEKEGYALFIGRFDSVKRIDWIIRAFKHFTTAGKARLKLVIVGDAGPTEGPGYKRTLLSLAKDDDRIIFCGYRSGSDKEELLSNCSLFILPSQSEGMPIALLEAMGYGRPCLVSDIPAHRWIISEGENGFLHSSDLDPFTEKLDHVLSLQRDQLGIIGEKAKETIEGKYNWARTIDKFESIYYTTLLGKHYEYPKQAAGQHSIG